MASRRNTTVGRNDPCPCGSGLKYKRCCLNSPHNLLNKDVEPSGRGSFVAEIPHGVSALPGTGSARQSKVTNRTVSDRANDKLKSSLENQQFESLEQAQRFIDRYMEQTNRSGLPEFHGISPEQMHRLINFPFESPSLLHFPDDYLVDDTVPYMLFFNHLLASIGSQGLKPTAKGNLPGYFCRSVAIKWEGEEGYAKRTRYAGINSEIDFSELNGFRHTCEFAGYLRKYRGKYIIGSECQQLLKTGGQSAVYRGLFKAFIEKLDWGFSDGYPDELSLIQYFWAFSLYLLQQFGDEWRPSTYYEDAFLYAFPAVASPTIKTSHGDPETVVKHAFRLRVLQHWLPWFGLAKVEKLEPDNMLSDAYRVRKTSLADQVAIFDI